MLNWVVWYLYGWMLSAALLYCNTCILVMWGCVICLSNCMCHSLFCVFMSSHPFTPLDTLPLRCSQTHSTTHLAKINLGFWFMTNSHVSYNFRITVAANTSGCLIVQFLSTTGGSYRSTHTWCWPNELKLEFQLRPLLEQSIALGLKRPDCLTLHYHPITTRAAFANNPAQQNFQFLFNF